MHGDLPDLDVVTSEVGSSRGRFLDSHRALAACSREFARLSKEVVLRAQELSRDELTEAVETRLAPERLIVQIGPVALTVSWLRSTLDSVADGRLLVVAWRGTVARGTMHRPEHSAAISGGQTAVALWEEVLVAEATSEQDWWWHSEGNERQRYDSTDLAARCIVPLREELVRLRVPAQA